MLQWLSSMSKNHAKKASSSVHQLETELRVFEWLLQEDDMEMGYAAFGLVSD